MSMERGRTSFYKFLTICFILIIIVPSSIYINFWHLKYNNITKDDTLLIVISFVERIVYVTNNFLSLIILIINYNVNGEIISNGLLINLSFKNLINYLIQFILTILSLLLFHIMLCKFQLNINCIVFVLINTITIVPMQLFKIYLINVLKRIGTNFIRITYELEIFDGKLLTCMKLMKTFNRNCLLINRLYDNIKFELISIVTLIFIELCYGTFNMIDFMLSDKEVHYKFVLFTWCLKLLIGNYVIFYHFDEINLKVGNLNS